MEVGTDDGPSPPAGRQATTGDGPSRSRSDRILRPGDTCMALERADRVAVVVDAADYFLALRAALLRARHQVLMIAWDFDTRIKLDPNQPRDGTPRRLGPLLTWLVKRTPTLNIHVLKWRLSLFQAAWRGMTPLFILDWITDPRLHYRLASDHPVGACHHQKIVVIDDAVAFCGGIDMTSDRWDTPEHRDRDFRRRSPGGRLYEPFHDTTMAVDGEAARALGDIARKRWTSATGEEIEAPPESLDAWPPSLSPLARDVEVGIGRTLPAYGDQEQVAEIERLWLAAIASARHRIYIEAQYFAGRRIARALQDRLLEADGPEIVILNPTGGKAWLETQAMGLARDHMLSALRATDPGGRFAILAPMTAGGRRIYVHSKVLIVDDRLLRVGSSNINNRSMGLDTECDLAIEATGDDDDLRTAILDLRDRLVSEHLGRTVAEVRATLAETASLVQTIETLRRRPGRTLVPLAGGKIGTTGEFLVETQMLDPERPRWPFQTLLHRVDWDWMQRRRCRKRTGGALSVGGGGPAR